MYDIRSSVLYDFIASLNFVLGFFSVKIFLPFCWRVAFSLSSASVSHAFASSIGVWIVLLLLQNRYLRNLCFGGTTKRIRCPPFSSLGLMVSPTPWFGTIRANDIPFEFDTDGQRIVSTAIVKLNRHVCLYAEFDNLGCCNIPSCILDHELNILLYSNSCRPTQRSKAGATCPASSGLVSHTFCSRVISRERKLSLASTL
jgi:hypothetical protein